jgi:hypothetical protein
LQALLPDLLDLVAWWRERQRLRVHPEGRRRDTVRYTIHLQAEWVERLKQQAADEGVSISEVANRALQRYFAGGGR